MTIIDSILPELHEIGPEEERAQNNLSSDVNSDRSLLPEDCTNRS